MNKMKEIRVEKVTLNMGIGEAGVKLEKAAKLLETITERKVAITKGKKRVPEWKVKKGMPIGCKVTIRGKEGVILLKRLLQAIENKLNKRSFDDSGNFSFGIKEYIDIPEMKYDPSIGMVGLDVCVTLSRPGFKIAKKKIKTGKISNKHKIKKPEAIDFMKKNFGVNVS